MEPSYRDWSFVLVLLCVPHELWSTVVLFCSSSRGPKDTSWSYSDAASRLCLSLSDAVGAERRLPAAHVDHTPPGA